MSSDSKKVKVTIEIEFADIKDYKMHISMVNERVNAFLKRPDSELTTEVDTGWSRHKFSIEYPE